MRTFNQPSALAVVSPPGGYEQLRFFRVLAGGGQDEKECEQIGADFFLRDCKMKGRKGNAALRRAKVDPAKRNRRRGRNQKAVEAAELRAREAQERAQQFAQGQESASMPPFMASDPQYAGAAAVWRHHEPMLRERHFWEPQFIAPFTGFCIYYDEFLAADREIKRKGWGIEGKSTSGGQRFWKNPAVDVRDHAFSRVLELSSRYAFTPLDLYRLERESAAAGSSRVKQSELPLDEQRPASRQSGPGSLTEFDSEPPPFGQHH